MKRLAVRAFNPSGKYLYSVSTPVMWPPGAVMKASCNASYSHTAPKKECRCGIYAVNRLSRIPESMRNAAYVTGIVEVGGTVIPGRYGMRAEEAQIVALIEAFGYPRRYLEIIARTYSVPIWTREQLEKMQDAANTEYKDKAKKEVIRWSMLAVLAVEAAALGLLISAFWAIALSVYSVITFFAVYGLRSMWKGAMSNPQNHAEEGWWVGLAAITAGEIAATIAFLYAAVTGIERGL